MLHLGAFGSMEDIPTGFADDLPTILGIFKHDPKSRIVNISLQRLDFAPNSIRGFAASQNSNQLLLLVDM